MKILPLSFKHKGFTLNQLKRAGNKAIYKKQKGVKNSKIVSYEVVIITSHTGYELAGTYIEPAEVYPSTSLWGVKGWSFTTLDYAENFFKTLKIKAKDLKLTISE